MARALTHSQLPVTLIGGGQVTPQDMADALAIGPFLVAADGGADRALALGAVPDLVIGDLDSLGPDARAQIPPDRLHRIAEQDTTDFEKCLSRIQAPLVLGIGFGGGRLDHQLAVLNVISRRRIPPVVLLGEVDICFASPPLLALDLEPGSRVSLFPMGPCTGRSQGLRWPINGLAFAPDGFAGTSNQVVGPVELEIDGPMLVILPRQALRRVVEWMINPAQ